MLYILALVLAIPTYGISIILLIVYLSIKEKPWRIKDAMEQAIIGSARKYIANYYANKDNSDEDSTQVALNLKYLSAFAYLSESASEIDQDVSSFRLVGSVKFTILINSKVYKGKLVNFGGAARLTARQYFKEPTKAERERHGNLEFNSVTGDWGSIDNIGASVIKRTEFPKGNYLVQVAELVHSRWRYAGAKDDWACDIHIKQSKEGVVEYENITIQPHNYSSDIKAKSFNDSIRRAVLKISPISMPFKQSDFKENIKIFFKVNMCNKSTRKFNTEKNVSSLSDVIKHSTPTIITVNKTGEYSITSLEGGVDSDEKSISGLVGTVLARMDFYPDMKVIIKGRVGSVHNLTTNLVSSLNESHLSSDYYYLTSNINETTQDGDKLLSFTLNRTSESVNWVDSLYYWQDEWGLECFPEDKNKLSDLKALRFESISYFQIGYHVSKLPKEIGNLTNLEVLILGNVVHEEIVITRLTELPKEIGNLTKLKYLYAQFNSLSTLPKEIGYLYSLIELKLGGNGISSLPKSIGHLSKLKLLTLWSNSLKSIPIEIGQLTQLEGLDLSGNPLTELPKEIVNLTNLKKLYLPDVKLSAIQKRWIEELKEYGCEVIV